MRLVALVALVALVVVSGCSGIRDESGPKDASGPATGETCIPAAGPAASASPSPVKTNGQKVPDLAIACFAGGGEVRLGHLGRPAVINLWASWCGPCRTELPALNTYAQRGTVLVVGVNTEDTRSRADSVVEDLKLGFPSLYDREGSLRRALGKATLPVTLFVGADGVIAYLHGSGALDTAGFERLAHEHLGVAA